MKVKYFFVNCITLFLFTFFLQNVYSQVVINEVSICPNDRMIATQLVKVDGSIIGTFPLSVNEPAAGEWIELYNNSCSPIDISGYYLGTFNSFDGDGMSYKIPSGKIIPAKGFALIRGENTAIPTGSNIIDIVATESEVSSFCIYLPHPSNNNQRMWFSNSTGWVGLYNSSGVALDALSWGGLLTPTNSNGRPCLPGNPLSPGLPSYSSFPSANKNNIPYTFATDGSGAPIKGKTFVRIPDGGAWSNTYASETSSYGTNNQTPVNLNFTITQDYPCSATSGSIQVSSPTGGVSPYEYKIGSGAASTAAYPATVTTTFPNLVAGTTYFITMKDNNGCEVTKSHTLTAPTGCCTPPAFTSVTLATICKGTTSTSVTYTATGSPDKYKIDWEPAANTAGLIDDATNQTLSSSPISITLPSTVPANVYQGTITPIISPSCSGTPFTISLTVKDVSITGVDNFCLEGSTTLSSINTPATSNPWAFNPVSDGAKATITNPTNNSSATITGNVGQTGTVNVEFTDNNGCKATKTITINPKLSVTIQPKISNNSSVTFQWSNLTGLNTITPGEDSYTVKEFVCASCSSPGAYVSGTGSLIYNTSTLKWEYTRSGLSASDKVFIEVTPVDNTPFSTPSCFTSSTSDMQAISCTSPTISTPPADLPVCEDGTATFSVIANNASSYQWQVKTASVWTDIPSETSASISYNAPIASNGTQIRVKLNESTGNCPVYSNPVTLTVKPKPVMVSISDKYFCPDVKVNDPALTIKDIEFKITSTTGSPTFTWLKGALDPNNNIAINNGATPVTEFSSFTTPTGHTSDLTSTITVTPTLNGCVGSPLDFKIIVKPKIKPVFSTPAASDITFSSVKFNWSSSISSITPNEWKVDTVSVLVNTPDPLPTNYVNVSPNRTSTQNFYTYNVKSGRKAFIIVTPISTGSTLFCADTARKYLIPLSCIKPVKPLTPLAAPVCEGSSINVTGVLPDALANFQWKISTDGGTIWNDVSTTDFGSTGTTNELTTTTTKTYMNNAQIKLVLTDILTGQCTEESDKVTLVINKLPTVKLIQPAKTSLCVDETEVSATVQPLLGLAPMKVDYTFNGVNFIDKDISTLDIKFGTSTETNHSLSIDKVVDANGCVNLLTGLVATVSVHKNPTPEFTVSDTIGCLPLLVNFIDISGETYKDVTWDFGTGTNSSKDMGTTTFTYQKEGDYTVTYSVENMKGCKSENVKVNLIHVKSPPKAMISSDRSLINIYENVVRFDSKLSQNATFYKWDFGDNSSISNEPLVNHKYDPNTPGKFKVYLIVSNSPTNMICSDTAITWIDFPEEVIYYIPNTFTPNGDEFNNTFQPIFSSGYDPQNYSFIIFDRWGQIVFESNNPTVGWDGTFGDKLLGNDTFVWKLGFKEKANDNEHYTTGHVNLVK